MIRVCTGLLLLSASVIAGTLPDSALYDIVFRRIVAQKQFGDRIDALGKNSAFVRAELRNQIGFTPSEYATLEAAAVDYVSAHTANLMKKKQFQAELKANPGSADTLKQLTDLDAQDAAMQQAHLGKVKTDLGPRFQLLDSFARTKILPHIDYKQGTPTPKGAQQ